MPFVRLCYPCQEPFSQNSIVLLQFTSGSLCLHLLTANLLVTCHSPITYASPSWNFAPVDILFFGLHLLSKRFFDFRFQNHPHPRNLACNLRATCNLLGTKLELGSKSRLEYGLGTWVGGEELMAKGPRFPPSELQTTPAALGESRRRASLPVISATTPLQ